MFLVCFFISTSIPLFSLCYSLKIVLVSSCLCKYVRLSLWYNWWTIKTSLSTTLMSVWLVALTGTLWRRYFNSRHFLFDPQSLVPRGCSMFFFWRNSPFIHSKIAQLYSGLHERSSVWVFCSSILAMRENLSIECTWNEQNYYQQHCLSHSLSEYSQANSLNGFL